MSTDYLVKSTMTTTTTKEKVKSLLSFAEVCFKKIGHHSRTIFLVSIAPYKSLTTTPPTHTCLPN